MEQVTVDALLTVTGVTLVTGILVQATKVLWPGDLSDQWKRRLALLFGVVLMLASTFAVGLTDVNIVLAVIVAVVNGIIAGLAAGAAFDTVKHGDARVVTRPE